jgi:hypothetical protein
VSSARFVGRWFVSPLYLIMICQIITGPAQYFLGSPL